eukprot:11181817-Lingulodinium_polyedra.AAC.1
MPLQVRQMRARKGRRAGPLGWRRLTSGIPRCRSRRCPQRNTGPGGAGQEPGPCGGPGMRDTAPAVADARQIRRGSR